ncbi:coiled-coil domain-containing protein 97 [Heracleum sosnowskyi]|uniref:Coiled-coil domain-containing protein 97 n=1 Tax=Heracleum sosnowskyi TaxID=360622 RepID=A0AAD8HJ72_9APIA|nr:coiled-coil domain-containing protein 97 [Heracleum sosnowskyi]
MQSKASGEKKKETQETMEVDRTTSLTIGRATMESISERLSELEDLYFPKAVESSTVNPSQRKSLLLDLLSRDVPVFLERYGSQLKFEELEEFDVLRDDYEVKWHLDHLRSVMKPTDEELKSRSAKVKNRRRAYMDKLIYDGQYFSEDAMREREPYLHHEYVGQYQDLSGRRMARPGERWSDTLMRRVDEGILVAKIRREQQRLGVPQKDWVGSEMELRQEEVEEEEESEEEEEEEEEESEEEEEESRKGGNAIGSSRMPEVLSSSNEISNTQPTTVMPDQGVQLLEEEMQDRMDQFTHIMHQKFMSGEDHQHLDYSKIDEDETLDDHWMREANQDAEEKYFDDD